MKWNGKVTPLFTEVLASLVPLWQQDRTLSFRSEEDEEKVDNGNDIDQDKKDDCDASDVACDPSLDGYHSRTNSFENPSSNPGQLQGYFLILFNNFLYNPICVNLSNKKGAVYWLRK